MKRGKGGGGVDIKMGRGGGLPHFFITLHFNYILGKVHMCLRKVKSFISFQYSVF